MGGCDEDHPRPALRLWRHRPHVAARLCASRSPASVAFELGGRGALPASGRGASSRGLGRHHADPAVASASLVGSDPGGDRGAQDPFSRAATRHHPRSPGRPQISLRDPLDRSPATGRARPPVAPGAPLRPRVHRDGPRRRGRLPCGRHQPGDGPCRRPTAATAAAARRRMAARPHRSPLPHE